MKTIITLLTGFFLLTNSLIAQPPPPPPDGPGNEKIEAMKIAFLTKRLQLTPEEAQKILAGL